MSATNSMKAGRTPYDVRWGKGIYTLTIMVLNSVKYIVVIVTLSEPLDYFLLTKLSLKNNCGTLLQPKVAKA